MKWVNMQVQTLRRMKWVKKNPKNKSADLLITIDRFLMCSQSFVSPPHRAWCWVQHLMIVSADRPHSGYSRMGQSVGSRCRSLSAASLHPSAQLSAISAAARGPLETCRCTKASFALENLQRKLNKSQVCLWCTTRLHLRSTIVLSKCTLENTRILCSNNTLSSVNQSEILGGS